MKWGLLNRIPKENTGTQANSCNQCVNASPPIKDGKLVLDQKVMEAREETSDCRPTPGVSW